MFTHKVSRSVLEQGEMWEDVTALVGDSFSCSISDTGGFRAASASLKGGWNTLSDWLEKGLGFHWVTEDGYGNVVWEGMIWAIRVVGQGWQQTRSLESLANRIRVAYTSHDVGGKLEIPGPNSWSQNLDSQAIYGIRELIQSIGESNAVRAQALATMILRQAAWPGTSRSRAEGEAQVTLNLQGYMGMFQWRVFNNLVSGMTDASSLIEMVVTAVGQFVYATRIRPNALEVPAYHNRNKTAATVLGETLDLGDGTDPWILGMYENRTLYYEPVQTTPTIYWYQDQHWPNLVDGSLQPPWLIRPNDVIVSPMAVMPGHQPQSDAYQDAATVVVKEVSISVPDKVSITGRHDERIEILLSRIQKGYW